jgi:hypothetical protein
MKKNDIFQMLASVPLQIIDESAYTLAELSEASDICETKMGKIAKGKTKSGEWEQVWKKSGRRICRAYRIKK